MDIDNILAQLELHNSTYAWIIRETEKVAKKLEALDRSKQFNPQSYESATNRFLELEIRFKRDRNEYNNTVSQIRTYFIDKHDIDIMGLLDDVQ